MADDKKEDDKSKDKGSPKKSGTFFGRITEDLYGSAKEGGKLSLFGVLLYLLVKDEKGKNLIKAAGKFIKSGFDWSATELEPLVAYVKGWAIEESRAFVRALKISLGITIVLGATLVISTAFIHPMLWKAVAGLTGSLLLTLVLHAQLLRVSLLLLVFELAAETLKESEELTLGMESMKSLPGMLIGGLRHGAREGLGLIGFVWRYVALACIWFYAGNIYLIITELHRAPALIFLGLLTVPILTFIPLALPYREKDGRERGPQFNTLMYICGFILLDIFVWCNLYDYIQIVMHHPNAWIHFAGRLGLVLCALWQIGISIYWSLRSARNNQRLMMAQVRPSGMAYAPAAPMPHNNLGWIVSGVVICFLIVAVTWIACNGALPGFPNGPDKPTPHQQKVALQQQRAAIIKLEAANRQVAEMRAKLATPTESTDAIH